MVIYGTAIVSTADNLIKAYVIGGESKLHPLNVPAASPWPAIQNAISSK